MEILVFFSALSSHTVANSPYQSLVSNSYWRKKAICGKGNFKEAAGLWRKCYTDSHPLLDFNVFFNVLFWISKFQCIFGFQSSSWQWRKCYTDSHPLLDFNVFFGFQSFNVFLDFKVAAGNGASVTLTHSPFGFCLPYISTNLVYL